MPRLARRRITMNYMQGLEGPAGAKVHRFHPAAFTRVRQPDASGHRATSEPPTRTQKSRLNSARSTFLRIFTRSNEPARLPRTGALPWSVTD